MPIQHQVINFDLKLRKQRNSSDTSSVDQKLIAPSQFYQIFQYSVFSVYTNKVKSPLRLHSQLVTPNHWLVTQRMNMR